MSKFTLFSILVGSAVLLGACTAKVSTDVQVQPTDEPTSSPEAMMNAPMVTPTPTATPIDISVDAQLKGTAALKSTDDKKDLNTDLQNTTVVNETFN